MKNLFKLGLLVPCIAFATGCNKNQITPLFGSNDYKLEATGTTGMYKVSSTKFIYEFNSKIRFNETEKSKYKIVFNTANAESSEGIHSIDDSTITTNIDKSKLSYITIDRGSFTTNVSGSTRIIDGFSSTIVVSLASIELKTDDWFKFPFECTLYKENNKVTSAKFNLKLYI